MHLRHSFNYWCLCLHQHSREVQSFDFERATKLRNVFSSTEKCRFKKTLLVHSIGVFRGQGYCISLNSSGTEAKVTNQTVISSYVLVKSFKWQNGLLYHKPHHPRTGRTKAKAIKALFESWTKEMRESVVGYMHWWWIEIQREIDKSFVTAFYDMLHLMHFAATVNVFWNP